jgi:hypothetical protein
MPDWSEVLPVLHAISRISGSDNDHVDGDELARELGRDPDDDVWLWNLLMLDLKGEYITVAGGGGGSMPQLIRLTREGRQEAERWPKAGALSSAQAEMLLAALDERIAETPDSDEKRRLQRLRDSAGQVGVDVLAGVMSAWLSRATGVSGQ